jgi:putative phosphoribosyl transferase
MKDFKNREDAGKKLARKLENYSDHQDLVVLGLPRGGVPVAFEVTKALSCPLDVFVVRKLGTPQNPELAMGAIASGNVRVMNDEVVRRSGVSDEEIDRVAKKEQEALEKRESIYRGARPEIDLEGKTVILVDDGLATGATMRAAVRALKEHQPGKIVVAVPTAPPDTCQAFQSEVDEVICLETPRPFFGVGGSYKNFSQTTNEEVREYLEKAEQF